MWYQAPAPLQFARIFGFGSTSTVRGTAIAAWGGAGSAGSNLLPFMLDWGRLSSCYNFTFPPGPPAGTTCSFWFDATTSGSGNNQTYGVSNGDWGTVDLSDWNCSPNTSTCTPPCSTNDSTLRAWISGSGVPSVGLNYPSPTFVCAGQGATHNVFAGNCSQGSLQCQTGKQFAFPVNDDCTPGAYDPNLTPPNQGQADRNFNMCPAPGTSIQYYDIVGFAWLMIGAPGCTPTTAGQCAVISGKDVGSLTKNPGHYCVNDPFYLTDPSPSNGWCLVTTFEQYSTSTGGNPGGGHSFNEDTVALTG